jgi:hypothetical protein
MTQVTAVRPAPTPPTPAPRGLIRWICTSNPFYALSAALFLVGLKLSVETQAEAVQTWALMGGLAAYTLLLAGAACLLVRTGEVWDDVRTIVLLVVLMLLATSVTFDEVLAFNPQRGVPLYLTGLLVAVGVSEAVLHGIRLRLPVLFRVPYYLTLAFFFLYPLTLVPVLGASRCEEGMWGMLGFSTIAGIVALTLLPAVRRGPSYTANNGSPWRWPLYPWTLFGVLAVAVVCRAFLLCWTMSLLDIYHPNGPQFGPFFLLLAPFGLAVAVVLLELGIVSRHWAVLAVAFALPIALVFLARIGLMHDPIYQECAGQFALRLGIDPVTVLLLAITTFYIYAALRRVPFSIEIMTAVLVVVAFLQPVNLSDGGNIPWRPTALVLAAAVQLGLGVRRRSAWRCLAAAAALIVAVDVALPHELTAPWRGFIRFHLILASVMVVGAAFRNAVGQLLRSLSATMVLLAFVATTLGTMDRPTTTVAWLIGAYPLGLALILAAYGWFLRHRGSQISAVIVGIGWTMTSGVRLYLLARQFVPGLDHIAVSLTLLALAVLISLGKAGVLTRWIDRILGPGWLPETQEKAPSVEPAPEGAFQSEPPPVTGELVQEGEPG